MFCDGCGLNLKQQKELPTADQFSAKERERLWTEEQARQRSEKQEAQHAKAREGAARRRAEEERAAEAAAARQAEGHEARQRAKGQQKRARGEHRSRRVPLGLGALSLALVAVAGVYSLTSNEDKPKDDGAAAKSEPKTATPRKKAAKKEHAGTSASAGAAAESCNKATATRELRERDQLGEGFAGISQLVCQDLTGDGVEDMAFTRQSIGSAGTLGWGVLVFENGEWTLPLFREDGSGVGIRAEGKDILRSIPNRLPGDPNCCPSGGARIARFGYQDGEFTKIGNDKIIEGQGRPSEFYDE